MIGKIISIYSRRQDTMNKKDRQEAEAWLAENSKPSHLLEVGEFLYSRETGRVVLCLI